MNPMNLDSSDEGLHGLMHNSGEQSQEGVSSLGIKNLHSSDSDTKMTNKNPREKSSPRKITHSRREDFLNQIEKTPVKDQLNNSYCEVATKQPSNRKLSLLVNSADGSVEAP